MAAISTFLENALLNEVLRNVNYAPVATVYLALYTTNPTAGDTGTEVVGGSYARQSTAFSAASGGSTANSGTVSFSNMPATTITHVGIRDALTTGNLLFYAALTASKTTNSGDTFTVNASDLNVSLT